MKAFADKIRDAEQNSDSLSLNLLKNADCLFVSS